MFEAARFAPDREASRTTIVNYLAVREGTFAAHVLKPFSARRATEIVAAPKVCAFVRCGGRVSRARLQGGGKHPCAFHSFLLSSNAAKPPAALQIESAIFKV